MVPSRTSFETNEFNFLMAVVRLHFLNKKFDTKYGAKKEIQNKATHKNTTTTTIPTTVGWAFKRNWKIKSGVEINY